MITPSLRSQGDPVFRNLTPLTAPMQIREETQTLWVDHVVKPLAEKTKEYPHPIMGFWLCASVALNPSMIQIMALTTHGVRHRRAYAPHYRALKWGKGAFNAGLIQKSQAALTYSYYKHFLKKPLVPVASRVAGRALPGIGWGLLAYDFYTLATKGKFMGFQVR